MGQAISRPLASRVVIVALAAVSAVAMAGAISTSGADGAQAAATKPSVKILGQRYLKQSASGAGTTNVLLKVGKLHFRSICADTGGGSVGLRIQVRSKQAGARAFAAGGMEALTATYQDAIAIDSNAPDGGSVHGQVLYPGGKYRQLEIVYGVKTLGADCVSRIVVKNA
jgi:hypothetical protein